MTSGCPAGVFMERLLTLCFVLLATFGCEANAAGADIGAIVLHGKWGSPEGVVDGLVAALEREHIRVRAPEMPWSRPRLYDKGVDDADAEMDAEIAKLRDGGAKRIFLIGHSLGANHVLHYASRVPVTGVVAIAPGHRPESPAYLKAFGADVRKARAMVAGGKGAETLSFLDLNSGNRREQMTASAAAFLSYFDAEGPLNMTRNVKGMRPEIPTLWIVPIGEDPRVRPFVVELYRSLPRNPGTRMAEPDADHLSAPGASTQIVVDWIREIAAKK